jgi:single-strand DNA-binding protein
MSQDNQITLRGFVTMEPKFRQTVQTATPVAEIRVGSTPRRLNRETGEWQDLPTSYFTVKCWRRLAINAVSSLHKGDMVVIRGRFYMNNWVDSQQRQRSTLEIEADSLGHDLAFGWTHYLRGTRPQAGRADGVNAGEMARQDIGSSDPDDRDDEYLGDAGQAGLPGAGLAPDGQAGPGDPGFSGDALASVPDMPFTDGEGDGVDDILAASGLTDDVSLPERDAVPF